MMDHQHVAEAVGASGEHVLAEVEEMLAELRAQMPTAAELKWLQDRKLQDERAAWLWQKLRAHVPWVFVVATLIGAGLAYLAQHSVHVTSK